jgi:hypothetical protein
MLDIAVVTSVTLLPPPRHMVSLVAVNLFVGHDRYASEFIADCPAAATVKPGTWVRPLAHKTHYCETQLAGVFTDLKILEVSPITAPLEVLHPTDVVRQNHLRRFLEEYRPKDDVEVEDKVVQYMDHRLQKLRQRFGTTKLPFQAYFELTPLELRGRKLLEIAFPDKHNDC